MADLPVGQVTFLFTDIEGSTRRWEADPEAMRAALATHDELLRSIIEAREGAVFKHTGDGVISVFASAQNAVEAAIACQRNLKLPVRMGISSGEAELRNGDYFGPPVNRAARVMSAGHGGQILVTAAVASELRGVELVDLGTHKLRDLAEDVRLFQVCADGLEASFPALKSLSTPGNLVPQPTSFVGREEALKRLAELVRSHRLVTLTGAGGVGKSRLALEVAGLLAGEFLDGAWVIELAPVRDVSAVEDVVASTLGISPRPDLSTLDSITQAIASRRMLLLIDNCEHVLTTAVPLVEALLSRCREVSVLATSREALRLAAEQRWPVSSLGLDEGVESEAVTLFIERAQAADPGFALIDAGDVEAVTSICGKLDGLALAIELAAARMVSMSPQEVDQHLGDRFRLLSASAQGLEHHQTLRRTFDWSYDLLADDERRLLNWCSVFADGFDAAAATAVCGDEALDEYQVLDLLDALVRKSLFTTQRVGGATRYDCLEPIRQFAEEHLGESGALDSVHLRHATYFADRAVEQWATYNSPQQRRAVDWVDLEYANLRSGFRWAAESGELEIAVAIAAHTTMLSSNLQRLESVQWAEELLPAATAADLPQLPRLLTAASVCSLMGRPNDGIHLAQESLRLGADPRYDPFESGYTSFWEMIGYRYAGPVERWVEICASLADREGLDGVVGLTGSLAVLPGIGRSEEARAFAERGMAAARALGVPSWIAFAAGGYGRAYADVDSAKALRFLQYSLEYAREHRNVYQEKTMLRDIASLEAVLGDPDRALELFDNSVAFFQLAGNRASSATTLADVVVVLDRIGQFEAAATVHGCSVPLGTSLVPELPHVLDHLRSVLGSESFDRCVADGSAMGFDAAMAHVRSEIARARGLLAGS